MRFLLTIAYNGAAYHGYQVQKGHITVQERLQDAVEAVFGKRYSLTGCSRTDSGVHARDFKALLETDADAPRIPFEKAPLALNSVLPEDISVLSAEPVSENFHPRYDVRLKEYEYLILNSNIKDPFLSGRACHYPKKLNAELMREAAGYFIGSHDFTAFMSSGSDVEDHVRTVFDCSVTENNKLISIKISGNGFLYNMVRIIVGTLVSVSEGKILPSEIPDIIASKDREKAGMTMPACGLYLNRVEYI